MNLCPCEIAREGPKCTASRYIARYRRRLSGPLRRDGHFRPHGGVSYDDLFDASAVRKALQPSAGVINAENSRWSVQGAGRYANAHMTQKEIALL